MHFNDPGILPASVHYFLRVSQFAREHLLFAESLGRFQVSPSYKLSRMKYDSFLLLAVTSGRMQCLSGEESVTLHPREVLLLDCRKPHTYFALEPAWFTFVHLGGAGAEDLYQVIHAACGLKAGEDLAPLVDKALEGLLAPLGQHKPPEETQVAQVLYQLLMALVLYAKARSFGAGDRGAMEAAQEYLLSHLGEKLGMGQVAARFGYSEGHFTRMFRRATGMTPYQFLLSARLDHSKHLLQTTALSIQEIADRAGFPSLANYSYAFRHFFGLTPTAFRRSPL